MSYLGNLGPTYLAGDATAPSSLRDEHGHIVLTRCGDARGPRVLGIPRNYQRLMLRGVVVDDCPAVDQFGESYYYDGDRDVWVPDDAWDESYDGPYVDTDEADELAGFGGPLEDLRRALSMGDTTAELVGPLGRSRRARRRALRRARRRAGRTRRRRRVRRVFKRIRSGAAKVLERIRKSKLFRAIQRGVSKLLSNKAVQKIAGRALSIFGIPARVTQGVLAREADLLKKGGRVRIAELIAKGKYKEAAKLIGGGFRKGAKAAMGDTPAELIGPLGAMADANAYDMETGTETWMMQGGIETPVAHVAAFVGLGEADPEQLVVSPTPQPGKWYRIRKGDNLFAVTSKAYGVKAGKDRLKKARWINRAQANRVYATTNTSNGMFPEGVISFLPAWADEPAATIEGQSGRSYALIYIPMEEGDEPPQRVIEMEPVPVMPLPPPPEAEPEPEPPPIVAPEPPPEPPPIVPPPEPAPPEPEPEPAPAPPEPPPVAPPAPPVEPRRLEPSKPPRCPAPLIWSEGGKACVYPSPEQGPQFPRRDELPPTPAPEPEPEPMPELPMPTPAPEPEPPAPEPMPELPGPPEPEAAPIAPPAPRGAEGDWLPTALMLLLLNQ